VGAGDLQEGRTEPGTYVAQGKKRDECSSILATMPFCSKDKSQRLAFLWKNKYIDLKSSK